MRYLAELSGPLLIHDSNFRLDGGGPGSATIEEINPIDDMAPIKEKRIRAPIKELSLIHI